MTSEQLTEFKQEAHTRSLYLLQVPFVFLPSPNDDDGVDTETGQKEDEDDGILVEFGESRIRKVDAIDGNGETASKQRQVVTGAIGLRDTASW